VTPARWVLDATCPTDALTVGAAAYELLAMIVSLEAMVVRPVV
jgi:hypothetical protein